MGYNGSMHERQETKKSRYARSYSLALGGLGLLSLIALGLLAAVLLRAWQAEQVFREARRSFDQHYAAWQAQGLQDYRVQFSNCNPRFCCQNATLLVQNGEREGLDPNCDTPPNAGFAHISSSALTMDEVYAWLQDQYYTDYGLDTLEVEYDPDQHYIRRLRWRSWVNDPYNELIYSDLSPIR